MHHTIKLFFACLALLTNQVQATAAHWDSDNQHVKHLSPPERTNTTTINGTAFSMLHPTLVLDGQQSPPNDIQKLRTKGALSGEFWFYSAGIELTVDFDHDGLYSSFGVSFDVDTLFTTVPVYAVMYLSYRGGPWNEYAISPQFVVSGSTVTDTVYLETQLESGYPSGHYDHYIEIYDAHSHHLLTQHGPADSHHLQSLPFEGYYHDERSFDGELTLSLTGTGPFAPALLPLLSILAVARQVKRSPTISPIK